MNKIKEFFNEYGKIVSKILINHIALSIFGLMVCLCTKTMNTVLFWVAGVFATLLYMFLLYMVMWELGARHNVKRYEEGEKPDKLLGLKISLVKNSVFILVAILIIVFSLFTTDDASAMNSFLATLKSVMVLFFDSMYMPIFTVCQFSAIFLILTIPEILCCTFSYLAGLSGMKCIFPDKKDNKKK